MKKNNKFKTIFENENIDKDRKSIYSKRKISLGIVSCMLSLALFVSMTKVDQVLSSPTGEQIKSEANKTIQTQDLKDVKNEQDDETSDNNSDELLSDDEIQAIRDKANKLENDYFFNGNMLEELKAELKKAKSDLSINYEETKARLIDEAIAKNAPAKQVLGEVRQAKTVKKPTINNVNIGDKVITGRGLIGANQRKSVNATCKIHVKILSSSGDTKEKAEFSIEPHERGNTWSVNLNNPLQKGDKVVAQQEFNGVFSEETTYQVKAQIADSYAGKLIMPKITVKSENVFVLEEDAVEDIINAFKLENEKLENVDGKTFEQNLYMPTGANDSTKPIDVSGDGKTLTITFSDKSKIELDISNKVTVEKITEVSNPPEIDHLKVVDGKITGKISGNGPFKRARVKIVKFGNTVPQSFCTKDGCTIDKNSTELGEVKVDEVTGKFSFDLKDDTLELGKHIGVIVKEYQKNNNCDTIQPELVIPNIKVRDPKKITEEEKAEIKEAIKKANTTAKGVSKLPNGTGSLNGIDAIIEFDKNGSVKVISPNDADITWEGGKPIIQKNDDGSTKVKADKTNDQISVEKEKLVVNKAPDAPTITTDFEKGEITITPNKLDTDAKTIEVTYKNPKGEEKTAVATKGDNGEWSVPENSDISVDKSTGVVTIKFEKIKNKSNVDAKVIDEGGITQEDSQPKKSKNESELIKVLPKKPEIKVDDVTGDISITPVEKNSDRVARKMDVTYTPVGETDSKTVTFERDDEGKWSIQGESDFKISEDGKTITIANNKIKSNTPIIAQTNDGDDSDLLKSEENNVTVPDKTAPKAPDVTVNTNDGSTTITPPKDADTKTVTVKYPDSNGAEQKIVATKGNNGWDIIEGENDGISIDPITGIIKISYDKLNKADTVSATAKDESGNESQSSIDTTLPPVPSIELTAEKNVTVTPPQDSPVVNGMEINYIPANSDEVKTIKVVKGSDDNWRIDGESVEGISVDAKSGVVTFKVGTAKELSKITAFSKIDENKKGLETAEKEVPDTTAPEAPEVKVQADGTVTITPKKDSDTKTVIVEYKDQNGVARTATGTKADNGEWTVNGDNGETIDIDSGVITIPTGKSNPGDKVVAKAKDSSNNESSPSEDTTKPAAPTVTPDQNSGNVVITPPTQGNLDGMDIEYKTPNNTDRKVRVQKEADDKWKIIGENPDGLTVDEGTGEVTIPKGKAKEKTEVIANSTLGVLRTPAENSPTNPNLVPDKTAPNPPKIEVDTQTGNLIITPPTDEDTTSVTVNYKDKAGTEKTVIATKGDDGWKITTGDNEEAVDKNSGVITILKGNYKPGQEVLAYGTDAVDNKSTEDNKTPVEVTFDLDGGKQDIGSSILVKGGNFVLPEIYDKQYFPENKQFAGWQIGNEFKNAGDTIKIDENTNVKAVWKDIEYKVSFNGNSGTGSMDDVIVKKGNTYELPENGFTAPDGKEFDGWMIGTEKRNVGDKITIDSDTEVSAIWKDKTSTPAPSPNPNKPSESTKPGESSNPGKSTEPSEGTKPGESSNPGKSTESSEGTKPGENLNPGKSTEPSNSSKSGESTKPTETTKISKNRKDDLNVSKTGQSEQLVFVGLVSLLSAGYIVFRRREGLK